MIVHYDGSLYRSEGLIVSWEPAPFLLLDLPLSVIEN